jgi:hypothetical protein
MSVLTTLLGAVTDDSTDHPDGADGGGRRARCRNCGRYYGANAAACPDCGSGNKLLGGPAGGTDQRHRRH